MNNVEILAPAGNMDCLNAAFNAGADAVYLGGNLFGARAFADNFCKDDLLYAIDKAHILDKKIYLTVNTLLSNSDIDGHLYDYIKPLYNEGLDAVIVQDLGVAYFLHENFKDLPLHASTQMTITSAGFLDTLKNNGFTRVVPARELSFPEIKALKKSSDLEVECFVHGALCYSYSGQCFLSFSRGGRSGNRGRCAQPCRLSYMIDGKESYLLSPKDLCMIEHVPELIDAGIDSFKIEGRMKKPEYVAMTAYTYRKHADLYLSLGKEGYERYKKDHAKEIEEDLSGLSDIYNRGGFTTGYYFMHNGPEIMSTKRPNHYGTKVAEVIKVTGRDMTLKVLAPINAHDVIDVRKDEASVYEFTTGTAYEPGDTFVMNYKKGQAPDTSCICYRIRNNELIEKIDNKIIGKAAKRKIVLKATLREGKPAYYEATCGNICVSYEGNTVDKALNKPMDKDRIESALSASGDTLFEVISVDLTLDDHIFIPVGALKEARRTLLDALEKKICESFKREDDNNAPKYFNAEKSAQSGFLISKLVRDESALNVALTDADTNLIYIPLDEPNFYNSYDKVFEKVRTSGKKLGVTLPTVLRMDYDDLSYMPHDADIYLVKDLTEIVFLNKLGIDNNRIRLDFNLYVWNRYAYLFHKKNGIDKFTVNLEQTDEEIVDFFNDEAIDPNDFELIVKTRLPVMTSAGCVLKTRGKCVKTGARTIINSKDGDLNVICDCRHCTNIILNNEELDRTGLKIALKLSHLRYDM